MTNEEARELIINGIMRNACIPKEKDWWNGALLKAIEKQDLIDRKGEWIYCEDDEGQDGYRCSECGFFVSWYYDYEDSNYILDYKACPHCLARMKGADDE